jgi:hypothetical protein
MADLIKETIAVTDPLIAADIAEHIGMHSISGADLLNIKTTYLRKWVHLTAQELNKSFI